MSAVPRAANRRKGRPRAGKQPKGRGAHYVYAALREQILRLDLEPSAKLDEMRLVGAFGLSRTPVREALIRLASEGLVFLLPNRGAQVAPLDLLEATQYFEALDLLQRAANHWAAIRRTDADLAEIRRTCDAYAAAAEGADAEAMIVSNTAFHGAIAAAARNRHLQANLMRLLDQGMRLHWMCHAHFDAPYIERVVSRARVEHDEIVAAIADGDARRADDLAHAHNESFRQVLKDFIARNLAPAVAVA
jgi:DNA-binding GntR family transcriptional regulator